MKRGRFVFLCEGGIIQPRGHSLRRIVRRRFGQRIGLLRGENALHRRIDTRLVDPVCAHRTRHGADPLLEIVYAAAHLKNDVATGEYRLHGGLAGTACCLGDGAHAHRVRDNEPVISEVVAQHSESSR